MKKKLVIIKLGGSVVTEKNSRTPQVRIDAIKRLAKELKILQDQGKYQFILIHGAGSFGHPIVRKYNLQKGMKTDRQKLAFCQTQQNMLSLNSMIMEQLLKVGLPVTTFTPHNFVLQQSGKLNYLEFGMIKGFLDKNFIPVLYGDMVLDDKWGCSVLSGDTTASYLANKLKVDKVIFLSDVDGIFDADPKKDPKAELISEITNINITQILKGLTSNNKNDVTGEMYGKIIAIKKDLRSIPVIITNGLKKDNLIRAADNNLIGTKLLFD